MATTIPTTHKMSGLILMPKTRTDYTIVQTWFNISKYLAFTPINLENNTSRNNKKYLVSKIYPLFLFLFYLGATIFSFYERFFMYKYFNISQVILDTIQGITELFFIEHIVLWSILRRNRWRRLIRRIAQLEEKISVNFNVGGVKDCSWTYIKLNILLFHLMYVAVHVYDNITNWKRVSYSLAFVIFRFTSYYFMFSTLFVYFLCAWLKNRYVFLDVFLKESISRRKLKLIFLEKESEYISGKLNEFSQIYKNLYLIVQEFNEIFGFQFFFITAVAVLEILNAVNYGIPINQNNSGINDNTVVNILYSMLYMICNSRIVMACDSVEKRGYKLRKTCLILRESVEKCELKKELSKLATFVEGLCPDFSAAGFWPVNQAVLSTLFSSVMTYLIIIIQFNITLK